MASSKSPMDKALRGSGGKHSTNGKGKKKRPVEDESEGEDLVHLKSELQPSKKSKFVNLTVDMFNGDTLAWFEALDERADPDLSKLERGALQKSVEFMESSARNVIKPFSDRKSVPEKGEGPFALVVSSSADRCCVVDKTLRKFPGALGKLFARHMKVPEQKEFLDTHAVGVAVGTPNRLLKLCQDGILKLDKLKVLVVDLQEDSKTFTVLTMPEVSRDFFKFFREFVNPLKQDVKVIVVKPLPGSDDVGESAKDGEESKKHKQHKPQRPKQPKKDKVKNKKMKDDDEKNFVIKFKDEVSGTSAST